MTNHSPEAVAAYPDDARAGWHGDKSTFSTEQNLALRTAFDAGRVSGRESMREEAAHDVEDSADQIRVGMTKASDLTDLDHEIGESVIAMLQRIATSVRAIPVSAPNPGEQK